MKSVPMIMIPTKEDNNKREEEALQKEKAKDAGGEPPHPLPLNLTLEELKDLHWVRALRGKKLVNRVKIGRREAANSKRSATSGISHSANSFRRVIAREVMSATICIEGGPVQHRPKETKRKRRRIVMTRRLLVWPWGFPNQLAR